MNNCRRDRAAIAIRAPLFSSRLSLMALFIAAAASAQNPPGRPGEPAPTPPPVAAKDARDATLVIETDAACELRVGDVQKDMVRPGAAYSMTVPPGAAAIECTSTTVPEVKANAARDVAAGGRTVVTLELADRIVGKVCSGKPATLADLGGGILRHCVTKTDWTQADSSADTTWEKARNACAARGSGWELPSSEELGELVDRSGHSQTPCGRFTCNVSPRFKLSAPSFWAREETGPEMRMLVSLMLGQRHPARMTLDNGYRVLCARHAQ